MSDGAAKSICFVDGNWQSGNVPLMGSTSNAAWLGNVVFDGARAFEGVAPDLELHCQRAIRSARSLHLKPSVTAQEIEELAWDGIGRFPSGTPLYVRPMFWAEDGLMVFDPDSTRFALVITHMPIPPVTAGFTTCLSTYRRPSPDQAPTFAKASCLYPIATLAIRAAAARGFSNAVMCDAVGNVAEFTGSNIWMVKDGVCHTPIPNGTFLNGITRQRVILLLRDRGVTVIERSIRPDELNDADEIFSTGNFAKVLPVIGYEDRQLQPGPMAHLARTAYWEFAHSGVRA